LSIVDPFFSVSGGFDLMTLKVCHILVGLFIEEFTVNLPTKFQADTTVQLSHYYDAFAA